jgi:hypothetical protein
MRLLDLRWMVLLAVCVAGVGWRASQLNSNSAAIDGNKSAEPALIHRHLSSGAQPIIGRPTSSVTPRHYDPNVQPAVAIGNGTLLATAAMGQTGFAVTKVTQKVGGHTFHWPIKNDQSVVRLVESSPFTLTGSGVPSDEINQIKVTGSGAGTVSHEPAKTQSGDDWVHNVSVTGAGRTELKIAKDGDGQSSFTVNIVIPTSDDQRLRRPAVSHASNNLFAERVSPIPSPVSIYGSYLTLAGTLVLPGTNLDFPIFQTVKPNEHEFLSFAVNTKPIRPREDGRWEAEVDIPQLLADAEGIVLAQASEPGGAFHRCSAPQQHMKFKVIADRNSLPKPTALVIADGDGKKLKPVKEGEFLYNNRAFQVKGRAKVDSAADTRMMILLDGQQQDIKDIKVTGEDWTANVTVDHDGDFRIEAATVLGNLAGSNSDPITLRIRKDGPEVDKVVPTTPELKEIKVIFNRPIHLSDGKNFNEAFILRESRTGGAVIASQKHSIADRTVTLSFVEVRPEVYTLTVVHDYIQDEFGNKMEADFETQLFRPIGAETPAISRGITGPTGPNVEFPEYTNPRKIIDGFNPSDRVETRVSRLYYYRDAHRVTQIVNRDVKSYNRAAVDMQQQLADKSRQIADQAADERRAKERAAIEAAQKTREAERELQEAEARAVSAANQAANAGADLQRIDQRLRGLPDDHPDRATLQAQSDNTRNVQTQLERVAESARRTAESAYHRVQTLRATEAAASEQWQASIAVEDRAREEQFRREVAAAHVDPDTYAPGKPGSEDPVRQVSVSVIGEGLIQLRGPIKGINVIRTMINQIDAPVGQVRVAVHTVQINGEKGDRMEQVAGKIQRFIDHSRFLTLQSAEMLRKAIVLVAAQRAMELGECAGMTQEERDRRYLHSFFGTDFIHELEVMDSEFLKTGNKLLSLHSMDSTSLASAMFIMALAKNTTRMEILQTFEGMLAGELPMAEQHYFEAGLTCDGKHRLFDKTCKREDFQLLSGNARFQSIRGLFDVEIAADDTMTPIQREFVRLAQIFKSRLIVEMELKQRVMERCLIEERLGDREKELLEAKEKENKAKDLLATAQRAMRDGQKRLLMAVNTTTAQTQATRDQAEKAKRSAQKATEPIRTLLLNVLNTDEELAKVTGLRLNNYIGALVREGRVKEAKELEQVYDKSQNAFFAPVDPNQAERIFGTRLSEFRTTLLTKLTEIEQALGLDVLGYEPVKYTDEIGKAVLFTARLDEQEVVVSVSAANEATVGQGQRLFDTKLADIRAKAEEILKAFAPFSLTADQQRKLDHANELLTQISAARENERLDNLLRAHTMFVLYCEVLAQLTERSGQIVREMDQIVAYVDSDEPRVNELFSRWLVCERDYSNLAMDMAQFSAGTEAFRALLAADLDYQFARRNAEAARRPLDHKKFLDMLVDEMEDKFIELLEGTRAHTANIDGYIKRLMTSLDDDFNTQFYYPTFRKVRLASQLWDVQMGQVETTNVLANNRAFAKVSPQATMEFDLPKRNIVIAEAIDGAKAMIDDVGALAQDPTFLAMAKLHSGQPTSSPGPGATGGLATVRNVLPGLSTDTAEAVLGQQGPGGAQFGAALEGLIPDPAIYKFETGTGWEIRPVIQPDGQAVVFGFNYMYSTNIREPVRADEKHLGRVKRHFVDTDVQLSNFELREVSRYTVALKASRTSRGVPLLEDIPWAGVLFRPLPSAESSLQQNIILSQATIFPTLFDLMGLRWAPVVADLDPLRLSNDEFIVRNRRRMLTNRVFDHSSSEVDRFLRVPDSERRMDLYRSQETIPSVHPNGYSGPGANLLDSHLQEGYTPTNQPETQYAPGQSPEGSPMRPQYPLFPPHSFPALDAPQRGRDSDQDAAPNGTGIPERLEQPLSQSIGPPIKPLTMPSAANREKASRGGLAEDDEVTRTAYLQPVPRTSSLPARSQATGREAPLLLRQVELRRLPLVDGTIRSN